VGTIRGRFEKAPKILGPRVFGIQHKGASQEKEGMDVACAGNDEFSNHEALVNNF
jgi:hypothetical protein